MSYVLNADHVWRRSPGLRRARRSDISCMPARHEGSRRLLSSDALTITFAKQELMMLTEFCASFWQGVRDFDVLPNTPRIEQGFVVNRSASLNTGE